MNDEQYRSGLMMLMDQIHACERQAHAVEKLWRDGTLTTDAMERYMRAVSARIDDLWSFGARLKSGHQPGHA